MYSESNFSFGSELSEIFFSLLSAYGFELFIATLIISFLILIGVNISGRFKGAIDDLVEANPTTISNPVVFTVFGILLFLGVIASLFIQVYAFIEMGDYFTYMGTASIISLIIGAIFGAVVSLAFTSLYFQPEKANVNIDKSSSTAEDLIALLSFSLKAPLRLARMISNYLVVLGSINMILGLVGTVFGDIGSGALLISGLTTLLFGVFSPFIFYLLFLLFYPVFNFGLAILQIPKIGKK